jgi:hypothetical protein
MRVMKTTTVVNVFFYIDDCHDAAAIVAVAFACCSWIV